MDSNDMVIKKVYGYTRVSTEEQVKDGNSLNNQRYAIEEYARRHNMEIVGWFTDEGISAKTANRPQLQAMLGACRRNRGKITHIVVYNISRISRNLESYSRDIGWQFAHNGVTLRSTMEPIDETPSGRLMLNISLAFHQFDNDVKGKTSHDNMVGVANNGWWVTQAPIGFITQKVGIGERMNDGHEKTRCILVPDTRNDLADKIATIFQTFAEANGAMSEADAWRMAIKLGIKMPKTGKDIGFSTFDRMLRRPVYAGYSNSPLLRTQELQKLRFDGLISIEVFHKVQILLDGNKRELRSSPDALYPLKGTLVCEKCGGHILGSAPANGSSNPSPRYHCRCKGHGSLGVLDTHNLFMRFLEEITPTDGTVKLFKEILRRTAAKKLGDANKELERLKDLEGRISTQIEDTLRSFLIEKTITAKEKEFFIERLESQREDIKAKIAEQEQAQRLNEHTISYVCNFITQPAKLWLDADLDSKKAFQQMLFPNGLHIDLKEKKCRTADLSPLYSVMANKKEPFDDSNSPMVTRAGVEPTTFSLGRSCSIQLSYQAIPPLYHSSHSPSTPSNAKTLTYHIQKFIRNF